MRDDDNTFTTVKTERSGVVIAEAILAPAVAAVRRARIRFANVNGAKVDFHFVVSVLCSGVICHNLAVRKGNGQRWIHFRIAVSSRRG